MEMYKQNMFIPTEREEVVARLVTVVASMLTKSLVALRKWLNLLMDLSIQHIEKHSCCLQQEVMSDLDFTRMWIERYPGLNFRDLRSEVIQHYLDSGDSKEAEQAAYHITSCRTCSYTCTAQSLSRDACSWPRS